MRYEFNRSRQFHLTEADSFISALSVAKSRLNGPNNFGAMLVNGKLHIYQGFPTSFTCRGGNIPCMQVIPVIYTPTFERPHPGGIPKILMTPFKLTMESVKTTGEPFPRAWAMDWRRRKRVGIVTRPGPGGVSQALLPYY